LLVGVCVSALSACAIDSRQSKRLDPTEVASRATVARRTPVVRLTTSAAGQPTATVLSSDEANELVASRGIPRAADVSERTTRFVEKGPLELVLVDHPLSGGAIAEVDLNFGTSRSRRMVIPRNELEDETIDRAMALAKSYEFQNPESREQVKFVLRRNGEYTRVTAAGTSLGHQIFQGFYNRRDRRSRWLRESASRVPLSDVPGIGRGRVMSLGTRPSN